MGQIVGAFVMPHDPLVFLDPEAAPEAQRTAVHEAYATIGKRLRELAVSTVVVVGADHYMLFGPGCLPQYLIGIGDVSGPVDRLPGLATGPIRNNEPLARHIMSTGFAEGFDWAVAKSLQVDHAIGVPVRMCVDAAGDVATVPVYLASGVEPTLAPRRAYELGGVIRRAVESWSGPDRVAVIGSGGISHWVGLPETGRINTDFDERVLACIVAGDADSLIALRDEDVVAQAGNGALEIRNFLCAMGATPGGEGEIIAYVPSPAWVTGLGFAEIRPRALS